MIDKNWIGEECPKDGECWIVRIKKEILPRKNKGCFILDPIKKVEEKDIAKLVPGLYKEEVKDDILFLHPNDSSVSWLVPLNLKSLNSKKYHAIITCLDFIEDE
jgi:hypothetical protein